MNELKTYRIKCEVLSPVHIGDGTEIGPLEYVIVDNKLYKINLNEFLCSLSDDLLKKLKDLQKRNNLIEIRKFIKENIDLNKFIEWQANISNTVGIHYKEKFDDIRNQLIISPFIRSNNKPYIPGSSIKGAIRTALLNWWSNNIQTPKDKSKSQNVEAEILNALYQDSQRKYKFDMTKDPFRALKVRDVFLPEASTIFSKISNFKIDKKDNQLRETSIQIIKEVIKSDISFDIEIVIDENLFQNLATKLQSRKIDIELLLSACNKFYSDVLESERKRLFDSRDINISDIYKTIQENAKDGMLLRIGWGSGFESITLEKFRHPKEPQRGRVGWGYSKNLVEGKYPLGWVKIKNG